MKRIAVAVCECGHRNEDHRLVVAYPGFYGEGGCIHCPCDEFKPSRMRRK